MSTVILGRRNTSPFEALVHPHEFPVPVHITPLQCQEFSQSHTGTESYHEERVILWPVLLAFLQEQLHFFFIERFYLLVFIPGKLKTLHHAEYGVDLQDFIIEGMVEDSAQTHPGLGTRWPAKARDHGCSGEDRARPFW